MSAIEPSRAWKQYEIRRWLKKTVERGIFGAYRLMASHSVDTAKHSVTISECTYSPWKCDEGFKADYERVRRSTLVDQCKLYELWRFAQELGELKGDVLEVGAWRGGSGCLIGLSLQKQGSTSKVFLCDTFEGMPETSGKEDNFYRGGELADTSFEHVKLLASSLELVNVEVLKGLFPRDTAAGIEERTFKFVHVDVDIYSSAKETVEWVWDRLVPGGVIVFDDYGYSATEGVTQFVDQFVRNNPRCFFMFNQCGHGVLIKRS